MTIPVETALAAQVGSLLFESMEMTGTVRLETANAQYTLEFGANVIMLRGHYGVPLGDYPFTMEGLADAMKRMKEIGI